MVFVYALGLMTDLYDTLYSTMMDPNNLEDTWVSGSIIYYDMQGFNRSLLRVAIGLILVSIVLFLTCTHSRRKYYIGNYVATGLTVAADIAAAVWAVPQLLAYKAQFLQIDFEALKNFSEMWNTRYSESTFWFDACFVVFGLLLVGAVLLVVNLIRKLSLMKEERRLIDAGKGVASA